MDKEIELDGGEEEVVEHTERVDDEQLTAFSTLLFFKEDESGVTRYFIIFFKGTEENNKFRTLLWKLAK